WRFNVGIAVELTIAIVPAGTSFSRCMAGTRYSPTLGSNLLFRPIELDSVDPHAMQNDRELARDSNLCLAEPVALGEPYSPGLHGGPFGTRVSRTPGASNR